MSQPWGPTELPPTPLPPPPAPLFTIVLNDLSEVVGHEIPKGALVGEAQAVWEEHRRVHHGAVDDLWDSKPVRDFRV